MRKYQPKSKPLKGTGKVWEPSDPDKALVRKGDELTEIDESITLTSAPSTSHLAGFRLFDGRKGVKSNAGGKRSTVLVRFRATKYAPASDYLYYFNEFGRARYAFAKLKSAPRPGQWIPWLQEVADKYQQVSVGSETDPNWEPQEV